MNKNAILKEEVVKIILSVISIMLLLYLFVSMAGIFTEKTRLEQARQSLDVITNQIDEVIEERLNESEVFFIESPNEWMISAWPYQDETDKPSICKKDYCVCICPIPNIATYGASFEECENTKVCKDYDIKLKTIYEAEAPTWISEKLRDFVSVFKDTQNVPIDITRGNLFTMKIKKGENNEILIVKEQNV